MRIKELQIPLCSLGLYGWEKTEEADKEAKRKWLN